MQQPLYKGQQRDSCEAASLAVPWRRGTKCSFFLMLFQSETPKTHHTYQFHPDERCINISAHPYLRISAAFNEMQLILPVRNGTSYIVSPNITPDENALGLLKSLSIVRHSRYSNELYRDNANVRAVAARCFYSFISSFSADTFNRFPSRNRCNHAVCLCNDVTDSRISS